METRKEWGRMMSLRRLSAVAAVGLFLVMCTFALAGESDAEIQQDLYLIPGFEQGFAVTGEVATSGEATIKFVLYKDHTEASRQLRLDTDVLEDKLTINKDRTYSYGFSLHFADPDAIGDRDQAKLGVIVTDYAGQMKKDDYTFKVVKPTFRVPSYNVDVRQGETCSVGAFIDRHGALEGDDYPLFSEKVYLVGPGKEHRVDLSANGYMGIPDDLPLGKNQYTLRLDLRGPAVGRDMVTHTYSSEGFYMTVFEKPVVSVDSGFECIVGDRLSIPLTLKDNTMTGSWTVQKQAGNPSVLKHSSAQQSAFVIENASSGDSGTYTVTFRTDSGGQSDPVTFTVRVFTPASEGVVTASGLVDDGHGGMLLQAGEQNNRTCMKLDSTKGFRFEALDSSGNDATSDFTIGEDGRLGVQPGTPEGKYTLRFYSDKEDTVQVMEVQLVYKAPPKIYNVAPVGDFRAL